MNILDVVELVTKKKEMALFEKIKEISLSGKRELESDGKERWVRDFDQEGLRLTYFRWENPSTFSKFQKVEVKNFYENSFDEYALVNDEIFCHSGVLPFSNISKATQDRIDYRYGTR